MFDSIKDSTKVLLKKFPLILKLKNEYDIQRILRIFKNKDFELIKIDYKRNQYQLFFSNKFGYAKQDYSPLFFYDSKAKYWVIEIENIGILFSKNNPCFSLINELRGYILLDNVKANDIVIDVGASDGLMSLYFAKKVSCSGKVFAIEPDPRWHKTIESNLKKNG